MLLQELLNSDVKYDVTIDNAKSFATRAEIGGRTIQFLAIVEALTPTVIRQVK